MCVKTNLSVSGLSRDDYEVLAFLRRKSLREDLRYAGLREDLEIEANETTTGREEQEVFEADQADADR